MLGHGRCECIDIAEGNKQRLTMNWSVVAAVGAGVRHSKAGHCSAMEARLHGDNLVSSGCLAGNLQGGFVGLSAAVDQKSSIGSREFAEASDRLVSNGDWSKSRDEREGLSLLGDGFYPAGMPLAEESHSMATIEVPVGFALGVEEAGAFAASDADGQERRC